MEFRGTHNYPPPPNPHVRDEIKARVISQLSVGAKPAAIRKQLINEATLPITRKEVPTHTQIYAWQHQIVVTSGTSAFSPFAALSHTANLVVDLVLDRVGSIPSVSRHILFALCHHYHTTTTLLFRSRTDVATELLAHYLLFHMHTVWLSLGLFLP
jgi:hypothetical protein